MYKIPPFFVSKYSAKADFIRIFLDIIFSSLRVSVMGYGFMSVLGY